MTRSVVVTVWQIYYGIKKAVFDVDKFLTVLFLKIRLEINGNRNLYS